RHRGQLRAPPGTVKHEDHSMSYDVNIDNRPAFRLAAMRHTGSYISIGRSFEEVSIWGAAQNAFRPDTQMVAVYWDDPETVPEAELRSDAGMTVPADLNIAGPVSEMQVPALRTASIVHVGPYAELGNAYRWLYGTWLPESGEEAGEYPPYEIYLNDPRSTAPADLRTWIHMPLV
ncbi:MAG: GyrI-like domain-containing protein, partial [Pseudomonadota bacterium]